MRKEKSRDAARSRRSKENHEFYELAKLLPLPAAITSQLDFLDKASIIRLTISFLKLRQFSVNGHPPWAPDFTTLGSVNPYSAQSALGQAGSSPSASGAASDETAGGGELELGRNSAASQRGNSITPSNVAFHPPSSRPTLQVAESYLGARAHHPHPHPDAELPSSIKSNASQFIKTTSAANLFDVHQGTHILQSLDGFAFAIGRDGRFLYISETVSMYLGLSQVEMTGSSVFDYTHQQDHAELAQQLGISGAPFASVGAHGGRDRHHQARQGRDSSSPRLPGSVQSQYSAASTETLLEEHMTHSTARKRLKAPAAHSGGRPGRQATGKMAGKRALVKSERQAEAANEHQAATHASQEDSNNNKTSASLKADRDLDGALPTTTTTTTNKPARAGTPPGAPAGPATTRTIEGDPLVRQFCIRMKSTLTKRGCQHFKSSGYRVVHVVAHLRSYQSNDHGHLMDPLDDPHQFQGSNGGSGGGGGDQQTASAGTTKQSASKQAKRRGPKSSQKVSPDAATATGASGGGAAPESASEELSKGDEKTERPGKLKIIGMVAVAIALPPPSINELRLESDTFVLRLGLDLKITHVEPKITELLNYPMELLAGRSLYSFIHPADLEQARDCHRELLQKGQVMSGYYRLLARTGGYIWIQTCATLICNNTLSAAPMLGTPTTVLGPGAGSVASPSPRLQAAQQQQQQQQPMGESDPLVALAGQAHGQMQPQVATYFQPGTPNTTLSTSFESHVIAEQQASHQQQQQQLLLHPSQQGPQQEQCVIFVNYMITNVIEAREILDVCQSKEFVPVLTSFSGSGHHQGVPTTAGGHNSSGGGGGGASNNNNNNNININNSNNNNNIANNHNHSNRHDHENDYVSPTSTCPSPCVAPGRAAGLVAAKSNSGYLSSHTPGIINLSSPAHRAPQSGAAKPAKAWRDQQAAPASRHAAGASKASRRQLAKAAKSQELQGSCVLDAHAGAASESSFGGESSPSAVASYAAAAAAAAAVAAAASGTAYDTTGRAFQSVQGSYAPSDGGVNLALGKHHQLDSGAPGSWLAVSGQQQQHHHQQQQQHQHNQHAQAHTHQHHLAAGQTTGQHAASIYASTADATSASVLTNDQQVVASDHYLGLDRSSIYEAATFAAAGLAAGGGYPAVAANYHPQHPHHHHHHHSQLSQQLEQHEKQQLQLHHQQQQQQHHHHHHHQQQQHQQHYHTAAHHAAGHNHWDTVADHHSLASMTAHHHHHASASAAAAAAVYSHQHHPPWF